MTDRIEGQMDVWEVLEDIKRERDAAAGEMVAGNPAGTPEWSGHETAPAATPRSTRSNHPKGAAVSEVESVLKVLCEAFVETFADIAGEEIAKARIEYDDKFAVLIEQSFLALVPKGFENEPTYRSHCREMIARVVAGEDLEPATDAEILNICYRLSSAGKPLNREAAAMYVQMFMSVFPDGDGVELEGVESLQRAAEPDVVAALIAKTRKKARFVGRSIEL